MTDFFVSPALEVSRPQQLALYRLLTYDAAQLLQSVVPVCVGTKRKLDHKRTRVVSAVPG